MLAILPHMCGLFRLKLQDFVQGQKQASFAPISLVNSSSLTISPTAIAFGAPPYLTPVTTPHKGEIG